MRLRYAYFVTCVGVEKDAAGNVVEVRCTYDPATRGGDSPDGRKVKGTIHWVNAATAVEVVEHLDPPRLSAFERVLFEFARPRVVVLTTPNREYNVTWETLPAGKFRHPDHRFEWTRPEFESWANGIADRFGYGARFEGVGDADPVLGAPTQMAVFEMR